MFLNRWMQSRSANENKPAVVTFSGGMGAQIISAAIYFYLRNEGRTVYADFSYFDDEERVAVAGRPGEVSHWPWQLDPFGLGRGSFESFPDTGKSKVKLIDDGANKLALGLKALRKPAVQRHFSIPGNIDDILPTGYSSGYLCIHMRRGDYVNVASHMVSDLEFIEMAGKFCGLVKNIVVVSDSSIGASFRQAVSQGFEQVVFLDDIDAFTTHHIMRSARILICSNSQFSLIAALLNPQALVLLPKQWFGQNDRAIEAPIHEACGFQILNSVSS